MEEPPTPVRTGVPRSKKSRRTTERCGLVLPVGRINRYVRESSGLPRCGKPAAIYLTAVLEYAVGEILMNAGNVARDLKKQRITPKHIMLGIKTDGELEQLLHNVIISGGGVFGNYAAPVKAEE